MPNLIPVYHKRGAQIFKMAKVDDMYHTIINQYKWFLFAAGKPPYTSIGFYADIPGFPKPAYKTTPLFLNRFVQFLSAHDEQDIEYYLRDEKIGELLREIQGYPRLKFCDGDPFNCTMANINDTLGKRSQKAFNMRRMMGEPTIKVGEHLQRAMGVMPQQSQTQSQQQQPQISQTEYVSANTQSAEAQLTPEQIEEERVEQIRIAEREELRQKMASGEGLMDFVTTGNTKPKETKKGAE